MIQNPHTFHTDPHTMAEKRTWYVVMITLITMVAEIIGGNLFHSMALLADGWHMGTHAGALGISLFAYYYARKHANNPIFTFGTGKVNALGGLISSIILALIALLVIGESITRLTHPVNINFNEAILVAIIGLLVNLISVWLLKDTGHNHSHHHDHHNHHQDSSYHEHKHETYHDHNLKAAYMHVLADALTSVTTILALLFGKYLSWIWMDPLMGIVGSCVILQWSYSLIKSTSAILLDHVSNPKLVNQITQILEEESTEIVDLHIWQIAPGKHSAIISLNADTPESSEYYKSRLGRFKDLVHLTIEVSQRNQT